MRNFLVLLLLVSSFSAFGHGRSDVEDAMEKVLQAQDAVEEAQVALSEAQDDLTTATSHLQDVLRRTPQRWMCYRSIGNRRYEGFGPTQPEALRDAYNTCVATVESRVCQRHEPICDFGRY